MGSIVTIKFINRSLKTRRYEDSGNNFKILGIHEVLHVWVASLKGQLCVYIHSILGPWVTWLHCQDLPGVEFQHVHKLSAKNIRDAGIGLKSGCSLPSFPGTLLGPCQRLVGRQQANTAGLNIPGLPPHVCVSASWLATADELSCSHPPTLCIMAPPASSRTPRKVVVRGSHLESKQIIFALKCPVVETSVPHLKIVLPDYCELQYRSLAGAVLCTNGPTFCLHDLHSPSWQAS